LVALIAMAAEVPTDRPTPDEDWLTVDKLLAAARQGLDRLTPAQALAACRSGAVLVDIRSEAQQARDGEIPGARRHPRNVLEWRLDPACEHRDADIARRDVRVILVCDEGYQSSLVAATARRFGVDATDVIGGFQAWRAAGLPVDSCG
jgi:rhodanese-related sulfurtransferase